MVFQITSRRSRAARLRRPIPAWAYALMGVGGLAMAVLMALRPH